MFVSRGKTTVKGQAKVDKFLRTIRGAKEAYVTIGLHEGAGKYTEGPNPPTVVEVGFWNEFGTVTSPERSWLRSAIDEGEAQIIKWRDEAIEKILAGEWSLDQALHSMGFKIMTLVQNKIKSNVPPPNEEKYAAEKKADGLADTTLIRSGLMLRSVTYKVYLNGSVSKGKEAG